MLVADEMSPRSRLVSKDAQTRNASPSVLGPDESVAGYEEVGLRASLPTNGRAETELSRRP
jgi:hypothetical protein